MHHPYGSTRSVCPEIHSLSSSPALYAPREPALTGSINSLLPAPRLIGSSGWRTLPDAGGLVRSGCLFLQGSGVQLHPSHEGCGFPRWCRGKEPACQCKRCRRLRFNPWVWRTPWRRTWQSTPVFLLGESHGQRSLESYSP